MTSEWARQLAAQSWCKPTTSGKVMDVDLAEEFANILDFELAKLRGEAEQMTVQLAGCSVAALGGTQNVAKRGDYGWSVAYQDVLDLRVRFDELQKKAT